MTKLPSMPLFVSDYEGDTVHRTFAEDGAYSRLLRLCWKTPGCSVPDDAAWIMRKMRASQTEYDELVKPIIEEYFKVKSGRIISERLSKEFRYATKQKRVKSKAGKAGVLAKALKNQQNNINSAGGLLDACEEQNGLPAKAPNPNPNPNKKHIPSKKALEVSFEEFWSICPKKVSKKACLSKFIGIIQRGEATIQDLFDGMVRHRGEVHGKEAQYIPHPQTWLNQGRWTDGQENQAPTFNLDPEVSRETVSPKDWAKRMGVWNDTKGWSPKWGPKPGEAGCLVPDEILTNGRTEL